MFGGRSRGTQRGRNSPVPNRRIIMGGLVPRPKRLPLGEPSWYKITVSTEKHINIVLVLLYYIVNIIIYCITT